MAKRFGRNQKRKLREAVASTEKNLSVAKQRIDSMQGLENALIQWNNDTIRLLGSYTAFQLQVPTRDHGPKGNIWRQIAIDRNTIWDMPMRADLEIAPMEIRRQLLDIFETRFEQDPMQDATRVRLVQHLGKGGIGLQILYSVSAEMELQVRDDDMLGDMVRDQFMRYLKRRRVGMLDKREKAA